MVGSQHRLSAIRQTAGEDIVDAALARPLSTDLVEKTILNIGQPQRTGTATLRTQVIKSGRATGFTAGRITKTHVAFQAQYPTVRTAGFSGQRVAPGMGQRGDSGSAVLDVDQRIVGLLSAGSDAATMLTAVQTVMNALNVTAA